MENTEVTDFQNYRDFAWARNVTDDHNYMVAMKLKRKIALENG